MVSVGLALKEVSMQVEARLVTCMIGNGLVSPDAVVVATEYS